MLFSKQKSTKLLEVCEICRHLFFKPCFFHSLKTLKVRKLRGSTTALSVRNPWRMWYIVSKQKIPLSPPLSLKKIAEPGKRGLSTKTNTDYVKKRNFRSSHSIVRHTWFNIAGFIQPDVIVNLLNGNDYDGFCDRQLFVCPSDLDVDYNKIQKPPIDTPLLKEVFKALDYQHSNTTTTNVYTLHPDAHVEFVAFHYNLNKRKRAQHHRDRDRKRVLSKSKGQVVRLATISTWSNQSGQIKQQRRTNMVLWNSLWIREKGYWPNELLHSTEVCFGKTSLFPSDYCYRKLRRTKWFRHSPCQTTLGIAVSSNHH